MYKYSFNAQFTIVYLNIVSAINLIFESKNYFPLYSNLNFPGFCNMTPCTLEHMY